MELLDVDNGEVIKETGRDGEVVVTMLWLEGNSSPLLRYRLGDLAMYTTYSEDPWQRRFTTKGRAALEKIYIPEGILQVAEFDRVV